MTAIYAILFLSAFVLAVPLYALPATLSLRGGRRQGLEPLTLSDAVVQLRRTGLEGLDLVEAARSLVGKRMSYCRRNSYDSYPRAFERGYGYCLQHAFALLHIVRELGFEAKIVHSLRNRFDDGKEASHAWVQLNYGGNTYWTDPLFYDEAKKSLAFTPAARVRNLSPLFRILTCWGAGAVNAHRYYRTGRDFS